MSGSRVFFALAILIPALPCGGQTVSMNPSKLSFSYTPGGPNPPSQGVSVASSGAAVAFVVRVQAPADNWLAVNAARGTGNPGRRDHRLATFPPDAHADAVTRRG